MSDISVIGLGAMGTALARSLIRAGHRVTVWNRSAEKAAPLVAEGAIAAQDPAEAVAAGPVILCCVRNHATTFDLLTPLGAALAGKDICDLSSGDVTEADKLVAALRGQGAAPLLGMINAYPSGIGKAETAILTVGDPAAWRRHGAIIRTLGGKSAYVGAEPAMLAALFAGLFTVRQGFMFGMIYGALACDRAGVDLQVFADNIPASAMALTQGYYDLFARTVPQGAYDDPEASLDVYRLAHEDVMGTIASLGTPDAFNRVMHDALVSAVEAGLGGKQLTALVPHLGQR